MKEVEIGAENTKKETEINDIKSILESNAAIKEQNEINDLKINKYKEKIERENERIRTNREKLELLLNSAREIGVTHEGNQTNEECKIKYEEEKKRLDKILKDSDGMRKRMAVHDRDQQKAILSLQNQIDSVQQTITSKAQYFFI